MQKNTLLFILAFCLAVLVSCNNQPASVTAVAKNDSVSYSVQHVDWIKTANVYEVNMRQYTKSGTFKEFKTHLPRLKDMGIQIVWFMPINPIGKINRKGKLGSYYSVADYKGINPEYGSLADFKDLVNEIHKLGMYAIIDWVPNHSAWDNPWTKSNPDFYTKDSTGNFIPPLGTDWTDVIELNYDNQQMRKEMIGALKFWIDSTNVDGFRFDHASGVPTDFWNVACDSLRKIKPVFLLAEAEQADHQYKAFDAGYGWVLHHLLHSIAKGEKNVSDLDAYFAKDTVEYKPNAIRLMFTTNHDENSWNGTEYEKFGEATKTFTALTYLVPGMPLLYSGQEAGLKKRLKFFEKDQIDWKNTELADYIKKLNQLKKDQESLWNAGWGAEMQRIKTDNDKNVFAFVREKGNSKVIGIFNLSKDQLKVNLQSGVNLDGMKDYFTNQQVNSASFDLKPWQYFILVK
ncbi:MAG: alpha-amylase family glycosyl hydrolase [Bacteroidales bacterium]